MDIIAFIPLILFFFSFVFWGILSQKTLNRAYLRKEMIATDVILFFLVHPNITRASFAIFSCMYIDGKGYYLLDNLDIECWNGKHILYSLSLAIPCIIVWVLGAPAVVLYYMYKHKHDLQEIDNKLRFGFLYNGYRSKTFYWEFVILYRKILIICISVFFTTVSVSVQALGALLILILSIYMQMRTRPFTHKILNIMEARGILAATVTIYCGLFYLTNALDEATKYFFFIAIVAVNFYFISYWLYHLTKTGWLIITKKFGFLRRKFDHDDGYEADFLKEHPQSKQTIIFRDHLRSTLVRYIAPEPPNWDAPKDMKDLFLSYISSDEADELPFNSCTCFRSSRKSSCNEFEIALTDKSDTFIEPEKVVLDIKSFSFEDDGEEIADESR